LKLLSIAAFIYNNSIYSNIEKTFYKLLTDYIADFVNISVDRFLIEKIFLATEQAE